MDIARPDLARKRRLRHWLYTVSALVVVALITVGVSRLEPAAPYVDADTVFVDTVRRGPMVREVRGTGTLVPETIRWIPAVTDGTVERIVIRPGATVEPDTVILELSNRDGVRGDGSIRRGSCRHGGVSWLPCAMPWRAQCHGEVVANPGGSSSRAACHR